MIQFLKAKEILDSRGKPTIEVELKTQKGAFRASVPSGASKGKYEAITLKTSKAVENVNKIIGPKLIGKDPTKQKEIDELMLGLDGTENKSKLGANVILAVSIAACRAGAAAENISLYRHIANLAETGSLFLLPRPCFNIINGGVHAKSGLGIQEFMVIPQKKSFAGNFVRASKIYQNLKEIIIKNYGENAIKVGDEGGFVPPTSNAQQTLFLLKNASKSNLEIKFALDCAASQFYKEGKYYLEGKEFTRSGLLDFYKELVNVFPIIFIEDPYAEEDWEGFKMINSQFSISNFQTLIVGDDLTVTNKERIKKAINNDCLNGVIIKPNQIGTVSETLEAVKTAKEGGIKIIVSHRSGETCDDFIADLAVGIGADFIKAGAPITKERMAKYNRLLKIENELK